MYFLHNWMDAFFEITSGALNTIYISTLYAWPVKNKSDFVLHFCWTLIEIWGYERRTAHWTYTPCPACVQTWTTASVRGLYQLALCIYLMVYQHSTIQAMLMHLSKQNSEAYKKLLRPRPHVYVFLAFLYCSPSSRE